MPAKGGKGFAADPERARIAGKKGGEAKVPKGFSSSHERAVAAGQKGGKARLAKYGKDALLHQLNKDKDHVSL